VTQRDAVTVVLASRARERGTDSSINTPITWRPDRVRGAQRSRQRGWHTEPVDPAPTAKANRPSFTAPVTSLTATLTASGTTISLIATRAASVW
jgi:hypothetical protein